MNILIKKIVRLLPDKQYLSLKYYSVFGRFPNWKTPQTYNEKLQWLKIFDRNPKYTQMVDKYAVKDYVAGLIGREYVIPTLGVWDKTDDIDWDVLPLKYVLKTTNGGGAKGVVICTDSNSFDKQDAVAKLNDSLNVDLYDVWREWPYKNVKHRIIAEEYLEEPGQASLNDYKVMCFDGKVKLIELHEGRFTNNHTQVFYDRDWNKTGISQGSYGKVCEKVTKRPELLDEMIRLSEILAKDIPHIRVDWYIVNHHLFFGELTFYDGSGLIPFDRYEDDLLMGSWITLPENKQESESTNKGFGNEGIDMFY